MTANVIAKVANRDTVKYYKDGAGTGLLFGMYVVLIQAILASFDYFLDSGSTEPKLSFLDYVLLMAGSMVAALASGIFLETANLYFSSPIFRGALSFCGNILLLEILIVTMWMFPS